MSSGTGRAELLGGSEAMEAVRRFARRASEVEVPVLLAGETGTGKTLLARWIHGKSERAGGPFVAVNCAGVPGSLFESEFFGHRRGAFTGAHADRRGFFELAHGGTLFLDEAGELEAGQQAKLLTVLEDHELRPVGGSRPVRVDVRVVAATSRDLARAVRAGEFRRDLFHRIALLHCVLPPLRSRPEDVEELARHFLGRAARKHGVAEPGLDGAVLDFLRSCPWPGNVRELAHLLEAAVILADGGSLDVECLRRALPPAHTVPDPRPLREEETPPDHRAGRRRGRRYTFHGSPEEEKRMIVEALERCRGNRTRAARELGMARNTLRARLRRYGIQG